MKKVWLLEGWHKRKGSEAWSLDEIAELIAQAITIGEEQAIEEIVQLIDARTYDSETGQCLSWVADASNVERGELIALIRGEEF